MHHHYHRWDSALYLYLLLLSSWLSLFTILFLFWQGNMNISSVYKVRFCLWWKLTGNIYSTVQKSQLIFLSQIYGTKYTVAMYPTLYPMPLPCMHFSKNVITSHRPQLWLAHLLALHFLLFISDCIFFSTKIWILLSLFKIKNNKVWGSLAEVEHCNGQFIPVSCWYCWIQTC